MRCTKNIAEIFQVFVAYAFRRDKFIRALHYSNIYDEVDDVEDNYQRQLPKSDYYFYKLIDDKLFDFIMTLINIYLIFRY